MIASPNNDQSQKSKEIIKDFEKNARTLWLFWVEKHCDSSEYKLIGIVSQAAKKTPESPTDGNFIYSIMTQALL